eukprot:10098_5
MRRFSSGRSGLWSIVMRRGSPPRVSTIRESPTLAVYISSLIINMAIAVVPQKRNVDIWLLSSLNAFLSATEVSSGPNCSIAHITTFTRLSLANLDASGPPWPSKSPLV